MLQYIGGKPVYLFQGNLPDIVEKRGLCPCYFRIHDPTINQSCLQKKICISKIIPCETKDVAVTPCEHTFLRDIT